MGTAVAATDPDNDTLYYALGGTDAASFKIGENTGQITVGDDTDLNYEAKTSYSVTVSVSDRLDSELNADTKIDDTVTVTINVTDVDEPLGAPGTPTAKTATTTTITATWTEPDDTGKPPVKEYWIRYWEKGANRGLNAWTVKTNEALMDVDSTNPNDPNSPLKPGTAYEVEVMADNGEGYGQWSKIGTLRTTAGVQQPGADDARAYRRADTHANENAHTDSNEDAYAHTDSHGYADSNTVTHTYANTDGYPNADTHTYACPGSGQADTDTTPTPRRPWRRLCRRLPRAPRRRQPRRLRQSRRRRRRQLPRLRRPRPRW